MKKLVKIHWPRKETKNALVTNSLTLLPPIKAQFDESDALTEKVLLFKLISQEYITMERVY